MEKCHGIIMTGPRKGKRCNYIAIGKKFCKIHEKKSPSEFITKEILDRRGITLEQLEEKQKRVVKSLSPREI